MNFELMHFSHGSPLLSFPYFYRVMRRHQSKLPHIGIIHQPTLSVGRYIYCPDEVDKRGGGSKLLPLPLGFRCKPIRLAAIVSFCSELFLVNRYPDVCVEPPLDLANDAVLQ